MFYLAVKFGGVQLLASNWELSTSVQLLWLILCAKVLYFHRGIGCFCMAGRMGKNGYCFCFYSGFRQAKCLFPFPFNVFLNVPLPWFFFLLVFSW